ncbi:MAG: glycosyltransferase [Limisphaerales bacterium]
MVSAIIPTIGRVESLRMLLQSLADQTRLPEEVLVADGSNSDGIKTLTHEAGWDRLGLRLRHLRVHPPNAVRQRCAAIGQARGDLLLLLDDDVVLDPECVAEMASILDKHPELVAVTADFSNQGWSKPTRLWRWYLRQAHGVQEGDWQGRIIGPLLRFGYNPSPAGPMPMEWLGAGNSLVRRSAYEAAGGFSNFFLHRCTTNEDVDLGIKLCRHGGIVLAPAARMAHMHAPGGRVTIAEAAEDDLYNRYLVMHRTQGRSALSAFGLSLLYITIETASNLGGCIRRLRSNGFGARTGGRLRALFRILLGKTPQETNS